MKLIKKIGLLIIVFIIVFVANIFFSTGYFRTIEKKFDGEIVKKIVLPGAEDITISTPDNFALISSTKRGFFNSNTIDKGDLYFMELESGNFNITNLTSNFKNEFAPHGISMFKIDSTYKIMAVNHTPKGHSLEVFNLKGKKLIFEKSLVDPLIISPNDVVLINDTQFYFTNDHKYTKGLGQLIEDYAGLSLSNVIYFDGENYREAARGIAYANGINFDAKRNLLFVASPRKFLIKVYKKEQNGDLTFIEDIFCGTGVDNIEFDSEGNLWVGAHPNLLSFASYAKGKKEISPSEIIKINYRDKNDYSIEQIYLEDGSSMSASTVAAPFKNLILTGNVMDNEFLVLKNK
ncbi:SMP-30/gluconolactonase/LRE family protein [Lutibacter flavus]|uniref:Arylesterase / paraoxonase n=1 Tax=Lutibacter flavus TaxID=691689 RepID=A0A238VFC8_9FLAO|nr:SMP-30/gluconolactonase/LRE family protein [Lutibacter flavus]SNR32219.1 arylesterase / paraoxonase [Lutibacter flavus]